MKVTKNDVVCDLGSGIGNFVMQAAICYGCESIGVEIMVDRHNVALTLRNEMISQASEFAKKEDFGKMDLVCGDFRDEELRQKMARATVIFVNNFGEIFSARADGNMKELLLDQYVERIFIQSKPGTRMITLYPLIFIKSLSERRDEERRDEMKEISDDTSFYDYETFTLPAPAVSWSADDIVVHMYTRVKQSREVSRSVVR